MADKITSPVTGLTLFTLATILASLDNISCNHTTESLKPTFAEQIRNVSFVVPKMHRVLLSCSVYNLEGHNVSWIQVATNKTLTAGHNYVTSDQRYNLYINNNGVNGTWYLEITGVRKSDEGWYKCQVDTDPVLESQGYLSVRETDWSQSCIEHCFQCEVEFGDDFAEWFEIPYCVSLCYADRSKDRVLCDDLATMFPRLRSIDYSAAKCCSPWKLMPRASV